MDPLYRGGDWGPERGPDTPKVVQLKSGGAANWTWFAWHPSPKILPQTAAFSKLWLDMETYCRAFNDHLTDGKIEGQRDERMPGHASNPGVLIDLCTFTFFSPSPRINLRSKITGSEHTHLYHQIALQLNQLAHQALAEYRAPGHVCSGAHGLLGLGKITSLNLNFLIHNTRPTHKSSIKYQIKSYQQNISPRYTIISQHDR